MRMNHSISRGSGRLGLPPTSTMRSNCSASPPTWAQDAIGRGLAFILGQVVALTFTLPGRLDFGLTSHDLCRCGRLLVSSR
jgi:hypothetical protein